MPTSSRFAVAVHVLTVLAQEGGRPVPSHQIARSVRTNPALIRRLLSMLAGAGLTTSRRGSGGGALLARDPRRITLLDIYRVVEEPELFTMHRTPPDPECLVGCNILPVLTRSTERARRALEDELARVTLAELHRDVVERAAAAAPSRPDRSSVPA